MPEAVCKQAGFAFFNDTILQEDAQRNEQHSL
jgi:hypothetical protein